MKTALVPLFTAALLGAAGSALAEPAIYQNGTLTIPNGAIFTDSRQDYYTHIVLGADADGKLDLLSAIKMPLTYVDSAEPVVEFTENGPVVTLHVAGNKSVPCVDLLEPAVNFKDGTFTVLLAETLTTASCVTALEPFELEIPLDVSGLDNNATYKVIVNDEVEASFHLYQMIVLKPGSPVVIDYVSTD